MIRQFRDPKLVVATHNFGKLEEIRDLLLPYAVAVTGAAELNLPEPEETETRTGLHFHPSRSIVTSTFPSGPTCPTPFSNRRSNSARPIFRANQ